MPGRIVVVGAGTAGIPAALAAIECGASVTLVEKTARVGGQLWASGAITSGAGSQLQRDKGIEDSADAHFEEVWELGRERAHPGLLHRATHGAGATIDWLGALGTRFTSDSPVRLGLADDHEVYRAARCYILEAPDEMGVYRGPVLALRLEAALARWRDSSRLSLLLDARVTALLDDGAGSVVGCRIETSAGVEEVLADAVVLATGGYGASQDLLRRFHGKYDRLITQGLPHATGDGLHLAEGVGGVVVNTDIVIPAMGAIEDPDHPGFRHRDAMVAFGRPPGIAGDIWINRLGQRFLAEDVESPDARERAILEQPGAVMTALFDETMRRGLTTEIGEWTASRLGDPPDPRLVVAATTLAELAARLEVPHGELIRAVESYNEAVDSGVDALGRRSMPKRIDTPPFYGVRTVSAVIVTFAGIEVDEHLRVLDGRGQPIPGLYAAGEILGGGQIQGDGFSSGMSVTPAITFGRLAASEALSRSESLVER